MNEIFDGYSDNTLFHDNALAELGALIDETDAAIRANEKMLSGQHVAENSLLLQRLLYGHYRMWKRSKR